MAARCISLFFVATTLLVTSVASATTFDTTGHVAAGARVSDAAAPVSLLQIALTPRFGNHGFAKTRALFGASRDIYVDEVRFTPYQYQTGPLALRAGGAGYDYKPLVETHLAHLDLGGLDFGIDHKLSRRIGVFASTSATLSLAQWTASNRHPMTDIAFELFLCASASRLEVEAGVELDEAWALIASAGLQGDPVHFTDGAKCLGDPPAFSSKQQAGLTLRYSGQFFYGTLGAGWEQEALHVDRASEYHTGIADADHAHEHDITDVASVSALLASAAIGVQW